MDGDRGWGRKGKDFVCLGGGGLGRCLMRSLSKGWDRLGRINWVGWIGGGEIIVCLSWWVNELSWWWCKG